MTRTRSILLPIDGSATAEAAARFAEDLALALGSRVLVLGVVQQTFVGTADDADLTDAIAESLFKTVEVEVARLRQAGVNAESLVVVAGSPYSGILEAASDQEVDMIVMGTHGSSGLGRAILGSAADRVARHADIPLVLVPLRPENR
jgi:nucleotide-binding universal stress UspA family protein